MQIRHGVSFLSVLLIVSSVAYSGVQLGDTNGKPCLPQGGSDGDGGLKNSDPIDLSTGGFQHRQADLVIPGRGLDFEIKRMYRSFGGLQAAIEGRAESWSSWWMIDGHRETPMGQHWDFNYNLRVSFPVPVFDPIAHDPGASPDPIIPDEFLPNAIHVMTGEGRVESFDKYAPSSGFASNVSAYYSNDYYRWRVEYASSDKPVYIVNQELVTYEFFAGFNSVHTNTSSTSVQLPYAGRLKSITDRNGNQILFTWETSSQGVERIDYADDTLSNRIDFVYHDEQYRSQNSPLAAEGIGQSVREQLIWVIQDHASRAFEYNYSFDKGFPMLADVTTPAIVSDGDFPLPLEHERFSTGRVWSYAYDNDNGLYNWWSGRMLTTITSPNGDIITENEYEYLPGFISNLDRNVGRVKRQRYGNAYYNYIVTDTMGSIVLPTHGDFDDDYFVWLNDRRGAITRFKYAGASSPLGFHHQLLEKVVFNGFDTNPNRQTWATESGGVYSWFYLDESTGNPDAIPTGLLYADGSMATGFHSIRDWETNDNWNVTFVGEPNGDERHSVLWHNPPAGTDPGSISEDPLRWGAIEKLTINSSDGLESITEEWKYDFSLSGAGGGCGCGSVGYETAHKDGKGYVTIKHFDPLNGDLLTVYQDMPIGTSMLTTGPQAVVLNSAAAVDSYVYNAHGQVTEHTHPSKMIPDGTLDFQVDSFEYGSTVGTNEYGRLIRSTVDFGDSSRENLLTQYEYDSVGNVVKVIEPDSDYVLYTYNQDFNLAQERFYDAAGTTLFAQTDYFFDANGNLVRTEVMNLDGDQQMAANTSLTSIFEYDAHDFQVTASREVGDFGGLLTSDASGRYDAFDTDDKFVTKKWEYDGGKNLIKFSNGEAVNGIGINQAENIVRYEYDARDLRVKKSQGTGSAVQLVTEYEYDENERLISSIIVDQSGLLPSQTNQISYDAFDRVVSQIDPMLNEYRYEYDENHNPVLLKVLGPIVVDTSSSAEPSELLAKITADYGVLDLRESQSVEIFDYDYTPPGSSSTSAGQQTILYEYNADSSIRKITSPSGHALLADEKILYYDTASRLEFQEDITGNITQYEYDPDSNVSKVMQTDISSIDGAIELFEVLYEYDAIDRRVAVVDGVGNRTEIKYDSRSNMLETVDARGNTDAYIYDSMNRLLSTSLGNGTVTASKAYDASSRLVSETDHNGNETTYEYDGLNRVVKITMPDGEFYQAHYDGNGNMSQYTDARGVSIDQTFDLNNRLLTRDVNEFGFQVPGMTEEDYTYDGLGRLRAAQNDFSKITREYDSRSNITREFQNIDVAGDFPVASDREVAYEFDLANNTTKLTYPGGREIFRTFDELNRMAGIFNDNLFADPITEFEYMGRRLLRREHGNGTRTDYAYNGIEDGAGGVTNAAGDFGFGRVAGISTTQVSTGDTLDAFAFAWDETQNRTVYDDTGSGMKNRRERAFGYDAANRLVSSDVDFPDLLTDYPSPTNNGITTYTLDGVYNRTDVSGFESNGAPIGTYTQTGDEAVNNQYTITPRVEGGEWMNVYDKNGNLTEKYQLTLADFNGDHEINFFDVSAFLEAFGLGDPSSDLNGDGVINFFDVSAFLVEHGLFADDTQLEQWYYTYDFRNQLIETMQKFGPTDVAMITTNTYDAAARRVIESLDLDGDGVVDTARHLIYGCASLWEVVEQIDIATGTTIQTHVYGLGIDDEVSYQYLDQGVPKDIWSHRDDLNSLTSITDSNGDVLERYEYGDYGKVSFFDETGLSLPASVYNAQHLYTGRSLIIGTGLYDYRYRVMEPEAGRFNQRDPLGYADSMNMYGYVVNNPYAFVDPYGLSIHSDVARKYIEGVVSRRFGNLKKAELRNRGRNIFNNDLPLNQADAKDADFKEATPEETAFHRNNNPNNRKFTHPDGFEVVYDECGNIVTDPQDRGTFNFKDNGDDPKGHLEEDIYPWLLWGTGPDDPSTYEERYNLMLDAGVAMGKKKAVDHATKKLIEHFLNNL